MNMPRKAFRRAVAVLLVVPLLCLGQPAPATAELIGTPRAGAVRARIERAVAEALVVHGVDAAQAKARAAALTDAEAARVAAGIDRLPAGADPVTTAAAIFLVLGAVVVFVIALPFILVVKAVKAHADRRSSGQVSPPETRDGPPPEPRY